MNRAVDKGVGSVRVSAASLSAITAAGIAPAPPRLMKLIGIAISFRLCSSKRLRKTRIDQNGRFDTAVEI